MVTRQQNLRRLLHPRHVAFIGGDDAAFAAKQCIETFDGLVWGVNPKRQSLGGATCFKSVVDLPEPPDAVFLATPRSVTIETVRALNSMGAGGVACYTAGFGELGKAGQAAEQELIEAAGDLAVIGPNCYGVVNYTNGAILWPFGAGTARCSNGFALIMQSGMIPSNCTMNDRSAPISYVISAGNQAVLAIEDYMLALVNDEAVTAIGLYIEGIKNLEKFAEACIASLQADKPVVVLKAGVSDIAAQLTVSHTGSLAGTDNAFQALFDQLGVIRVDNPVDLLETLKLLSISGAPLGNKVAAFTCSGGDAAMLADNCAKVGLDLKQPSEAAAAKLTELLPDIATVSNPLDYTTPIWGDTEVMPKVFETLIADGFDAALVVQDFPPDHIHSDKTHYRNDACSFSATCQLLNIPGAVCSDLPENIDRTSREMIIEYGVTPLQGIDSAMRAVASASRYGSMKNTLRSELQQNGFRRITVPEIGAPSILLNEWRGKKMISAAGIEVPSSRVSDGAGILAVAKELGYPIVLKVLSDKLSHKSDVGGVVVGINNDSELLVVKEEMVASVLSANNDVEVCEFLVESMVDDSIIELLVGIKTDPQFGQLLVIASGGIFVELMQDAVTLLLPTNRQKISSALEALHSYPILKGFRGRACANLDKLVDSIHSVAEFAEQHSTSLVEMDINPLMVTPDRAVAVDVMIRKAV